MLGLCCSRGAHDVVQAHLVARVRGPPSAHAGEKKQMLRIAFISPGAGKKDASGPCGSSAVTTGSMLKLLNSLNRPVDRDAPASADGRRGPAAHAASTPKVRL